MKFLSLLLVALFALFSISHAQVISLDQTNFGLNINTNNDNQRFMIKFFAPWCGFCKKIASDWIELGQKYVDDENMVIAEVDCTIEKELCKIFDIAGFPTIIYGKGNKYAQYNSGRSLDAFIEFTESEWDVDTLEDTMPDFTPPFLAEYLSSENLKLVQELQHDLEEIWDIRRNALGVIVLITFFIGALFGRVCCAPRQRKIKTD